MNIATSPMLNTPPRTYAQAVMERMPPLYCVVWDCKGGQYVEHFYTINDAEYGAAEQWNHLTYAYTVIVEKGVPRVEVWEPEDLRQRQERENAAEGMYNRGSVSR